MVRDITPPEESQGTQFIPQSDDEETLWNVVEIVKEKPGKYFVRWEGEDPATGKPWPNSWVSRHDCTSDLVAEWKQKKREKERDSSRKGKSKGKKSESAN